MKHTKGPWMMNTVENGKPKVFGKDDFYCVIHGKNKEANARLIVNSPELLKALRILVQHAQEKYPHFESKRGQNHIELALETIAKAEGREGLR